MTVRNLRMYMSRRRAILLSQEAVHIIGMQGVATPFKKGCIPYFMLRSIWI